MLPDVADGVAARVPGTEAETTDEKVGAKKKMKADGTGGPGLPTGIFLGRAGRLHPGSPLELMETPGGSVTALFKACDGTGAETRPFDSGSDFGKGRGGRTPEGSILSRTGSTVDKDDNNQALRQGPRHRQCCVVAGMLPMYRSVLLGWAQLYFSRFQTSTFIPIRLPQIGAH